MPYHGFPVGTTEFLQGVRSNNDKSWFEAHRKEYERDYVEAGKAFVEAAAARIHEFAPGVNAEPRILGSVMRINRDIRFSKDKRPYKDHLDLWFWEGPRKGAVSGLFLRLLPEAMWVGVGAHHFDRDQLERFRRGVADQSTGDRLLKAIWSLSKSGIEVKGESFKRVPPGYELPDGDRSRLLRFGGLYTIVEHPAGPWVNTAEALERPLSVWRASLPIHQWLVDVLG